MCKMDNIFEGVKKIKKFKQVMLESSIIEKLKAMNKGSPNEVIKYLLDVNPDNSLKLKIEGLEEQIIEIQTKFERLIKLNNLIA